ncbi:hypothetical protein DFJ63DRAFT_317693 [Scheffersomyces coipomensis]|uniref:uncharacterized protein n=1 Tax=Scheffersomyces coipomensis TaxID=1788519 RepID=UPI00315D3A10
MKDLGLCQRFLGLNIFQYPDGSKAISAADYTKSIFASYSLDPDAHNPLQIPLVAQQHLEDIPTTATTTDNHEYRSIVGKL